MLTPAAITLYSVTAAENLPSIAKEGLRAGSYWTSRKDVANYYAETIEDEDQTPVYLRIQLSALDASHLAPDTNGIEEPLTFTLGMREEEISSRWDDSDKTWNDCLDLIGSLRYFETVPAAALMVENDEEKVVPLDEYMRAEAAWQNSIL
jgi:hypothetical protein